MSVLSVYTDGGARGNPGPAAIGVVVKNEQGKVIHQFGRVIGETTNNVAEYQAVIAALGWLESQPRPERVKFNLDSTLVVHQLRGEWKIKEPHLKPLVQAARDKMAKLNCLFSFQAIPRERNFEADALVNLSLDKC